MLFRWGPEPLEEHGGNPEVPRGEGSSRDNYTPYLLQPVARAAAGEIGTVCSYVALAVN
jgi:hypothetical protein